jgi:hypothetical protein
MMNERIKELLKQAKNETIKEFGDRTFQWDDFYYRRSEILADLIVKECTYILSKEYERLYLLAEVEQDSIFARDFDVCAEKCLDNIQAIEEHFGLE